MANVTKDAKNVRISKALHKQLKRAAGKEKLFPFTDRVVKSGLKAEAVK